MGVDGTRSRPGGSRRTRGVVVLLGLVLALPGCAAAEGPDGDDPLGAATSAEGPRAVVRAEGGAPSPVDVGLIAGDPADRDAEVSVVAGVDVEPGTYRTVEVQVPDGMNGGLLFDRSCTFGQYDDPDGGLDALIAGGTADGGRPTVTLGEGHRFRTQRCGAWQRVEPTDLFTAPDEAPTVIGDGMWLVGEDLRPGTYRTDAEFSGEYVEGAFCGWEVDSTWTDWDAEIVELAFAGPGPGEVTVATGQQLVSSECGTWRLVPSG